MLLKELTQIIEQTVLLEDEKKRYFLQRLPTYPPAVLKQMLGILHEEEAHLIAVVRGRKSSEMTEKKALLNARLLETEQQHLIEIEKAEAALEQELQLL